MTPSVVLWEEITRVIGESPLEFETLIISDMFRYKYGSGAEHCSLVRRPSKRKTHLRSCDYGLSPRAVQEAG